MVRGLKIETQGKKGTVSSGSLICVHFLKGCEWLRDLSGVISLFPEHRQMSRPASAAFDRVMNKYARQRSVAAYGERRKRERAHRVGSTRSVVLAVN
jgi:hypothetical protein